jgi:hypothetical protein
VHFHGALWTKFLTAEALYALAPVYLRKAVFTALYHGDSLGRTGFVALLAAYTLILLNKWLGGISNDTKAYIYARTGRMVM